MKTTASGSSFDNPYIRMRPSPAWSPGCFYCGNGVPWFQCHCKDAKEAQSGQRVKPLFIPASKSPNGKPLIILDPEAAPRSWLAKQVPHYHGPLNQPPAQPPLPPVNTQPVHTQPDPVHNPDPVNTAAEKRKAYRREWMRRLRSTKPQKP